VCVCVCVCVYQPHRYQDNCPTPFRQPCRRKKKTVMSLIVAIGTRASRANHISSFLRWSLSKLAPLKLWLSRVSIRSRETSEESGNVKLRLIFISGRTITQSVGLVSAQQKHSHPDWIRRGYALLSTHPPDARERAGTNERETTVTPESL